MLSRVDILTVEGSLLSLPLEDTTNGYVVESITGLDPVKATLVSSSFANMDGEQFYSSRRETRNIVITLGLEPDYENNTVQSLRAYLYRFFMPKTSVQLKFYDDDGKMYGINGTIETCESTLFSKEPGVTISLVCFDPDFFDPAFTSVAGNSVNVTTPPLETIVYGGSVETGALITVDINRVVTEITIYQQLANGTLTSMEFSYPLQAGDKVLINTQPGQKYARVYRGGTYTSALYAVAPRSYWMELYPGGISYRVYIEGAAVPYTIQYLNKYGGL